jgi:3-oxoacyl-(acyl-carrier-protein) synthase
MEQGVTPVYIFGHGSIAAPGYGPAPLLDGLATGYAPPRDPEWSLPEYPYRQVNAISNFDPAAYIKLRGLRSLSRASRLACVAGAAALSYPQPLPGPADRHAVSLATQWGSVEPLVEFNRDAAVEGAQLVNPAQFPNVVVNVHAGYLGIFFGLAGPNLTLCGRSAGLEAIGQAIDLLVLGRADYVLAGAVEALGRTVLYGLERAGELDTGAPPGEAAAFMLLGREPNTERPPLARLAGWGTATAHNTAGASPAREAALRAALEMAAMREAEIGRAWHADRLQVPEGSLSLQPVTGDCRAANSALAAVVAAHQVAQDRLPTLVTAFPPVGPQTALIITGA